HWTPFGSPSATAARLLAADASTRVRFVPNPNFNGAVSVGITFRAWDQNSGSNGGTADVTTNGGNTAFSTATETAGITVNSVNDAPTLDNSGNMTLTDVNEDTTTPPGDLVSAIIASAGGDRITDPDTGAVEGIAVNFVNNSNGNWEFSTDGGAHWTAFGSPSDSASRLLAADANTRVRLVPKPDFSGIVGNFFAFRAWDQTSGSNGGTADVTTNGGSTAFSAATQTASIFISPINDAPVLDNSGDMTLTTIDEDSVNNPGDLISSIIASAGGDRITDADLAALEGIAVVAVDNSHGTWQYSTN